ncbi:hypothetical protein CTZ27_14905 [Streptomyces griseocarneus]|nr:hypothetical protein CTZ27_14905 [Streptomyces griseocarneus]
MNDGADRPLRAVLVLLVLGLAGPAAVLHQQIGHVLGGAPDGPGDTRPSAVSAPDAPAER